MPQGFTLRVEGLREFLYATDRAGKEVKRDVRNTLRKAAEPVRDEARQTVAGYDADVAAGLRIYVRATGTVSVEQSQRRTTGLRGDFAAKQRLDLEDAAGNHEEETVKALEDAMERIMERFGG